jgi:hypothetical protein
MLAGLVDVDRPFIANVPGGDGENLSPLSIHNIRHAGAGRHPVFC